MFSIINRTLASSVVLLTAVFLLCPLMAGAEPPDVGIDENLGQKIPLDTLKFTDEQGDVISLKSLFDRPVVLTLVYYRCPAACTPLLNEVARIVQRSKYEAGKDYKLITISFDPREDAKLASMKQINMLKSMTEKKIPASSWRFLTGDEENIRILTESVGFKYTEDMNGQDFVHATTLTFIGTDGMIARYLVGTEFNPADFEMAVVDATEGRARSFMKKVQRLCYSYEPESRGYVLKLNRIILVVTVLFVGVFVAFLLFIKPKSKKKQAPDSETDTTPTTTSEVSAENPMMSTKADTPEPVESTAENENTPSDDGKD